MNKLYETIASLCAKNGIKPGKMCTDLGISRGNISDLKMGRIESLSAEKLSKIATYFNVSVDYLLSGEDTKKAPTPKGERKISDDDIKFALFGGDGEITDAMYDEVKRFAQMVKLREEAEKKKE